MGLSDSIRNRSNQHLPKNGISKDEDKAMARAAKRVIEYIKNYYHDQWFADHPEYDVVYETSIRLVDMVGFIARKNPNILADFDSSFNDKEIRPDGGAIYLTKQDSDGHLIEKLPIVIAEVKHQGTNEKRLAEGLRMQAFGNAIERLGKNLIGIRAMMAYESITPFICFGDGCDFANIDEIDDIVSKYDGKTYNDGTLIDLDDIRKRFLNGSITVRAKIYTMNEFYPLNKIVVFKPSSRSTPVSMMFRYKQWTEDEMYKNMCFIAQASFNYYTLGGVYR